MREHPEPTVVLMPAADAEESRATFARCARIMIQLIEVDLRELGEGPNKLLVEHQEVRGDRKTAQRIREYRRRTRKRHREEIP